jgi:AbrB family looped-hinge helix DNA binding protein
LEAENIVKVSTTGQIVIPKEVRDRFGIAPGGKLLMVVSDGEIILKKFKGVPLGELSKRLSAQAERRKADVDAVVDDAIRWARKRTASDHGQ